MQPLAQNPLFRRIRRHIEKYIEKDNPRLSSLKKFLRLENALLFRSHRSGETGRQVCRARTILIDVLIQTLFRLATRTQPTISLIALGGYGRAEMSPRSDVDLMILCPEKCARSLQEPLMENLLYFLWDLKFKVGHSFRTISQAIEEAEKNIVSKNAMLDARFICGEEPLFHTFVTSFAHHCQNDPQAYFQTQFALQTDRHKKYGNTVFLQEPEIKNGVGGLRDYHSILWATHLSKKIPPSSSRLTEAYDFLLRIRNELHFSHPYATDLLELAIQPELAWNLGYRHADLFKRVEAFMKAYYQSAQRIFQCFQVTREYVSLQEPHSVTSLDGFLLGEKTLTFEREDVYQQDPKRLIRVFEYLQKHEVTMDFKLLELTQKQCSLLTPTMTRSSELLQCFLSVLSNPGKVYHPLFQMHETGVLERFIPEFESLRCLVQHEFYHRYTADIHTLNTLRELDAVFLSDNPYRKILGSTKNPELLYLILLLHDIGKATAIKKHASAGTELAKSILYRLNIPLSSQAIILFVIQNHLEMFRFWNRYDVDDPKTAESFAKRVQNRENLCYLTVHTYCDSRGTVKTLWNGYKEKLHLHLYQVTLAHLQQKTHKTDPLLTAITNSTTPMPIINWQEDPNHAFCMVSIITWNHPGLFFKLAGAFTLTGWNILSSQAISRPDQIVIDTFHVAYSSDQTRRVLFEKKVRETLLYGKNLLPEMEQKVQMATSSPYRKATRLNVALPPTVEIYRDPSLDQTIVEIQANDKIGLLFKLAKTIFDHGYDIVFARISTENDVAIDTFYLKNIAGKEEVGSFAALEEDLRKGIV